MQQSCNKTAKGRVGNLSLYIIALYAAYRCTLQAGCSRESLYKCCLTNSGITENQRMLRRPRSSSLPHFVKHLILSGAANKWAVAPLIGGDIGNIPQRTPFPPTPP